MAAHEQNKTMKAIVTKYHGPGNLRGSRISASDEDGNRVFVPVDNSKSTEDSHHRAALELCRKMKWDGSLAWGGLKHGNVYVFVDGQDLIIAPKL